MSTDCTAGTRFLFGADTEAAMMESGAADGKVKAVGYDSAGVEISRKGFLEVGLGGSLSLRGVRVLVGGGAGEGIRLRKGLFEDKSTLRVVVRAAKIGHG